MVKNCKGQSLVQTLMTPMTHPNSLPHRIKHSNTALPFTVFSLKNVDNKASKQSRGGGSHTIYESELGGCAEDAIDLVRKLLKIVPEERSTGVSTN